jgi:hypothetical protein
MVKKRESLVLQQIINWRYLSENLATGGQPSELQLAAVASEGYDVVINLGLANKDYSLADEKKVWSQSARPCAFTSRMGIADHVGS